MKLRAFYTYAADPAKEALGYLFYCPGCKKAHSIRIDRGGWDFNGSMDRPTFTPSYLLPRSSRGEDGMVSQGRCHLLILEGTIYYQRDCDHELAGRDVDMVDWSEEYWQAF